MTNPILSLCIPTFNRAEILDKTLSFFTNEQVFRESDEVEVVISDNCSTDNTEQVALKYLINFPGKIVYHKNNENIHDKNFERVFKLASGDFLKFNNDNLIHKPGALAHILEKIKEKKNSKPVLFFLNGNTKSTEFETTCTNLNEFVSHCSFISTWGGAFGIWKSHFDEINDFSRYADLKLIQTDILFRLIANGKRVTVMNAPLFDGINVGRKGGYNITEIFGKNYLYLLNEYKTLGVLNNEVYDLEKKLIFLNHIIPFYFSPDHDFIKGKFFENLEEYKNESYFLETIESILNKITL